MKNRKFEASWIALLAVTAIAIYLCWLMLQPFAEVLIWATVLVIVFYPAHRQLLARTRQPALSAALSCGLVITTILLPLMLIALAVGNELVGAAADLQGFFAGLLDPNSPITGRALRWLGQYVNIDQLRSQQFIVERLKNISSSVAGRTLGFVGGLLGFVVDIAFTVFTMYYLFRDGDRILAVLKDALPLQATQSEEIFRRTQDVIGASVYGSLVIAVIQGALGGIAFWVLGIRSAVVWGVAMMLLSLIPMAGAFLVWVPAAIFLAVSGHWVKAVLLVTWGTLVIGTIDNFLRPKLVGGRTKLHELFIFFSVIGGLQVFGVLGIVLGPVVLAITIALFDIIRQGVRSPGATPGEPALVERADLTGEPVK
jgi:predicted PurR-regulated permease PerM